MNVIFTQGEQCYQAEQWMRHEAAADQNDRGSSLENSEEALPSCGRITTVLLFSA